MPEVRTPPSSRMAELLAGVDSVAERGFLTAEYFEHLLRLMVDSIEAERGYLWRLIGDTAEAALAVNRNADSVEQERALAREVFHTATPAIWTDPLCPSAAAYLLVPLVDHEHCFAVASFRTLIETPDSAESQLAVLTAIAERVGKNRINEELLVAHRAWQVMLGVGRDLDVKPMAYNVVNRLSSYLEADRISLAIRRGNQCRVKAISNQAVFDPRSPVVRQQAKLAAQVARTGEPFIFPQEGRELAPALRKMVERYFELANTGAIALVPIFGAPKRRDDPEDMAAIIRSEDDHQECVGVLVVEGIGRSLDVHRVFRRWNRVRAAVSQTVANSRQYDGLWLMPLWRALGAFADLYRGHTRRKAALITAAIAIVVGALFVIPGDFKVRGEGAIQPRSRQHVYAEVDGTIERLYVVDGDEVTRGDVLLTLRNPELAARVAEVAGKLREAETQLRMLTLQRVSQSFESEQQERETLQNASRVEARAKGLKEQLELLRRTQQQLEVAAPIDGQVITWDVLQRLKDRPVKPGERLLTIAVPSSGWEVELRIPDKLAGYLLQVWNSRRTNGEPVVASFVLTSNVSAVFRGQVTEVAPSSNLDEKENENVVRVRVRLPDEALMDLGRVKPGTSVIGHVHCGTASIGYCKLYEFVDWTRRMWFRFVA